MLNEIPLTDAQIKRAKHILRTDAINARFRLITEVLSDLDPPDGVKREFDQWSRLQMYDGYRAQHVAEVLTAEYS